MSACIKGKHKHSSHLQGSGLAQPAPTCPCAASGRQRQCSRWALESAPHCGPAALGQSHSTTPQKHPGSCAAVSARAPAAPAPPAAARRARRRAPTRAAGWRAAAGGSCCCSCGAVGGAAAACGQSRQQRQLRGALPSRPSGPRLTWATASQLQSWPAVRQPPSSPRLPRSQQSRALASWSAS